MSFEQKLIVTRHRVGSGGFLNKDVCGSATGRMDDMLNMSGHLLSTVEVESALGSHPLVAEAAAVARHHKVKGECLHCFVTLKDSVPQIITPELRQELVNLVRAKIAPFAAPDYIQVRAFVVKD